MKVLLINKFYYRRGGAETVFFLTKKQLEAVGHKVVIFSMHHPRNEYTPDEKYFVGRVDFDQHDSWIRGIKKILKSFYSFEAKNKLQILINEEKPDVAHVHNFLHQLTPSILRVLKRNKIPIVQTLHDFQLISPSYNLEPNDYSELSGVRLGLILRQRKIRNSFGISLWAILESWMIKWFRLYEPLVDIFVSPSRFLRDQCLKQGIKTTIEILPNPVQSDNADEIQSIENQDAKHIVDGLVCVSRLVSGKGLEELIRIIGQKPEITLEIVGHGPLWEELNEVIKTNNFYNIMLLGEMTENEIEEQLRRHRLVIVTSRLLENQPMAILEAMARGKAVLAPNLGGIPEIIQNHKTGWLYDPKTEGDLAQKIDWLYPQTALIDQLGRQAQQYVKEHHSLMQYGQKLLQIYLKVLNRKMKTG